jgi:sigma-B regulation protein RsbU (phosphoserine phosphatase)
MSTVNDKTPDILVVDDTPANLQLICGMLRSHGYKVRPVASATLALQAAKTSPPDLILLDINMPELNGYEVCERLKGENETRDVPIIFLSALHETIDKVKAFKSGGVDYISKPFQFEEVEARVTTHLRLKALREESEQRAQDLEKAYTELEESQNALKAELARAAEYVLSLFPSPLTEGPVRADWSMTPSAHLGGDGLGYHWLDPEHFAFYLLDVSGHGVNSALLAVSILNALRTCGIANVDCGDPGAVLSALNRSYVAHRRSHLHFTIWYGVFDLQSKRLRYSAAGHPPAIVRSPVGKNLRLVSSAPPLGCFADVKFPTAEMLVNLPSDVYVFSDGMFEMRRGDDTRALESLVEFLLDPNLTDGRSPADVRHRATGLLEGRPLPDDCSVLKLSFA